jgi:hypothetical protein
MLGGAVSDTSLAHARVMLQTAHAAQGAAPANATRTKARKEPA